MPNYAAGILPRQQAGPGDYLQFVRMIMNGGRGSGNQILKPETVALMGKNAMGDTRVVMLKTTNPARSGMRSSSRVFRRAGGSPS